MAKKYSKKAAETKLKDIQDRLKALAGELDDLHENVEGANLVEDGKLGLTTWEVNSVANKLCSNQHTMSFFKK